MALTATLTPQPRLATASAQVDPELLRALKEQASGARLSVEWSTALLILDIGEAELRVPFDCDPELIAAFERHPWSDELQLLGASHESACPPKLVELGVESVVCAPVFVDRRCIGQLVLADREASALNDEQMRIVEDTAYVIGRRVERFLGPEREERRESLMRRAVSPAFAELRNALVPLNLGTTDLQGVAAELMPVMSALESLPPEMRESAKHAYGDLCDIVDELARASERVREVVMTVEAVWGEGGRAVGVGELIETACGLALHSTRLVGGVERPTLRSDLSVVVRRSVAVAALGLLLSRSAEANANAVSEVTPLRIEHAVDEETVYLWIRGKNLADEQVAEICSEVDMLLLGDPCMRVRSEGKELVLEIRRRT